MKAQTQAMTMLSGFTCMVTDANVTNIAASSEKNPNRKARIVNNRRILHVCPVPSTFARIPMKRKTQTMDRVTLRTSMNRSLDMTILVVSLIVLVSSITSFVSRVMAELMREAKMDPQLPP
uniref:Uncharacterized protein n=1 Tax=Vannella robusta TaxID=1487602 RepID=A0A7S4M7C6_9EUKA